jgi:hypothetical protein
MSDLQCLQDVAPAAAPVPCLHCEKAPAAGRLGLCERCGSTRAIRQLYRRRRGWTPEFEAHLMRLRRRAEQRLPLFDGPLVVGRPRDGRIHPLRTFSPLSDLPSLGRWASGGR